MRRLSSETGGRYFDLNVGRASDDSKLVSSIGAASFGVICIEYDKDRLKDVMPCGYTPIDVDRQQRVLVSIQ
jgi:hypothetical protein